MISRQDDSNGRAIRHDFAARRRAYALLAETLGIEKPV
jgi:hypothetical protein